MRNLASWDRICAIVVKNPTELFEGRLETSSTLFHMTLLPRDMYTVFGRSTFHGSLPCERRIARLQPPSNDHAVCFGTDARRFQICETSAITHKTNFAVGLYYIYIYMFCSPFFFSRPSQTVSKTYKYSISTHIYIDYSWGMIYTLIIHGVYDIIYCFRPMDDSPNHFPIFYGGWGTNPIIQ